jgi:elongation of very long chain fatty acids protein 6
MAFTVSKAFELFDTVFVVLRKQPLVFLHWYHHVTVLVYVWYSHTDFTAPGRWFMTLNYIVHSFMYSHYAVRASGLGRLLPPAISIFITTLQIIQMGVGLVVTGSAYRFKSALGEDCHQSYHNMFYCAAMYASYLVLFVHFFWGKYVRQASSSSSPRLVVNGKRETAAHYHKSD